MAAGTQQSRDEETGLLEGLAAAAKEQDLRHWPRLYPASQASGAITPLRATDGSASKG